MTNIGEFYKCNVCGNFVEVVENGAGELTCCGQAMDLMEIQTEGEKAPKHAPVVEIDGDKVTVCVGEVQHPMDDDHYIQFIELTVGDEKYLKQLKPGDEPKATFIVDAADDVNLEMNLKQLSL